MATTAFGLEAVVKREIEQLGYTPTRTDNGFVEFEGDETAVVRANLWLRTAERVLIVMGRFHADTFDSLFEQTKALPWSDVLPETAEFPVSGKSVRSTLSSVPACQRIVKKAIVESLKRTYGRSEFPETSSRFPIEVSLLKDEATLTLDTSGAGLHKRGYRMLTAAAPIRETLAAALVLLSRWLPHRPFADPLCGSGTIAVEAAMIAKNIAPGLNRSFAAEAWPLVPAAAWQQGRDQAKEAVRSDVEVHIHASDIDAKVLSLAGFHARKAGVADCIHISQLDVRNFRPSESYGCIVTNPPYGERMGAEAEVSALYRTMGKTFAALDRWSVFVITSHPSFESLYGKRADKKRKLYNGRIQTNLYQYLGPLPPRQPS
ncbi:class I SAM-dependent RNA methyltransferase [Alicyclobacillus cycloheptanicus]|jgi:putative N6-adenine-specific DNA methylase|nr:class I SAM-dependent RNA methyltransferase [Alicyclobacillus cycloheptanicus]WDM02972.1 class I SAM-dependent RNA methyltransferase [Alicyclobacillus cycloheptanicus]